MKSHVLAALCASVVLSTSGFVDAAKLEPASLFSNHMVLQRDALVPVWGVADTGSNVTVDFAGQNVTARANDLGDWTVALKRMPASAEPRPLRITSGDKTVQVEDVLVGDVWLGSGQSNMAGRVSSYAKNDETLAALAAKAPFPGIRLMQGGPKPTWTQSDEKSVAVFSAIHFAFGERLHRELNVPIGLIVGAVGGTPSGYWIPPETYATSEKCKAVVAESAKTWDPISVERLHKAKLAAWERRVAVAKANGKKARGRKPQPPKGPGESSRGGKIGGLYERYISSIQGYRIKGVLWDQGEARSGVVGVDQHTMMSELIRGWRETIGPPDMPFLFVQKPSGGGSAFSNEDPITRNGDKFVANVPQITALPPNGGDDRFLYVRLMKDVANSWMVPASDLGSGIHPTNKWGYGNRAAEVALSQVYKTGIQAYGPTYRSHTINGAEVTIQFDHVGKGLVAAHADRLQGFAIAGADNSWHWADARIDGDTVILSSDAVKKPQRIRYAYAQKRAWANLFNKDGLPALAFDASN